uniref:Uncharacterized protein n=1 Tax=Timema douglasi TaxID=61478 RepID=A0A7R8VNK1_TIMDO|nr:unnamed protein product [Timema douglasi]
MSIQVVPLTYSCEVKNRIWERYTMLNVSDILSQKSSTYTCLVHGSFSNQAVSVQVEMIDRSVVPVCAAESGVGGLQWAVTSPNNEAIQDCPMPYAGTVHRSCSLHDTHVARWSQQDFSRCVTPQLTRILDTFESLTLGYENTTVALSLAECLQYLQQHPLMYPGEGEPVIILLRRVHDFLNLTSLHQEFLDSAVTWFQILNLLLETENSTMSEKVLAARFMGYYLDVWVVISVVEMQDLVRSEAVTWGSLLPHPSSAHLELSTLIVDVAIIEGMDRYSLHFPTGTMSYPSWLSEKLDVHVEGSVTEMLRNGSVTLAIIVYKNLSQFLPRRNVAKLGDGIETQIPTVHVPCPSDGKETQIHTVHAPCPSDGIETQIPKVHVPCPSDGIETQIPKVHVPCPSDGNETQIPTVHAPCPSDGKETQIPPVHVPCPSDGNETQIPTVHVPCPSDGNETQIPTIHVPCPSDGKETQIHTVHAPCPSDGNETQKPTVYVSCPSDGNETQIPTVHVPCPSDGKETEYEINSHVVSLEVRRDGQPFNSSTTKMSVSLEMDTFVKDYNPYNWDVTCAVAQVVKFSHSWDLSSCVTRRLDSNLTSCQCSQPGSYTVLLTSRGAQAGAQTMENYHLVVLLGFVFCLLQTMLTLLLLLPYWWRHRSCLIYLKLQCCTATSGAMGVFIYAVRDSIPKSSFPYVTTSLEALLLIGMSSHLSKVLIVYTEVVQLPKIKHLKQTVVSVITGVPVLAVLCSHLAHDSTGWHLKSWWLIFGTMLFNIFVTSVAIMLVLFVFLYCSVMRKLRILSGKDIRDNKAVMHRVGFLKRGATVMSSMLLMEASSVCYINLPGRTYHYIFSFSSALLTSGFYFWGGVECLVNFSHRLTGSVIAYTWVRVVPPIDPQGFIIFVCYVWKSETPVCVHILRQLKLNGSSEEHSSESINSPLRFFTKQEGEVETEGAPPWGNRPGNTRPEGQGLESEPRQGLLLSEARNKRVSKAPLPDVAPSTVETYVNSEDCSVEDKGAPGPDVDIQNYPGSPRKYEQDAQLYFDYTPRASAPSDQGACVKSYISFSHHDVTNSAPDIANIKTHETTVDGEKGYLNDSSAPPNSEVGLNTDSKDLQPVTDYQRVDFPTQTRVSYDKTGCEPRANLDSDTSQGLDNDLEDSVVDSTDTPSKGKSEPTISHEDNNIDCMMNRISHDLDYLLNRKSPLSKRHSRRGSTFEKDSARTSESNT